VIQRDSRQWLAVQNMIGLSLLAGASFYLAFTVPSLGFLFALSHYCLFALSRTPSTRIAFYGGMALGLIFYIPKLFFFWNIFGAAAILLWFVPTVYLALFLLLSRICRARCEPFTAALLIPCFWTGLEYFRSELYYLRFSWLSSGFAFAHSPQLARIAPIGIYGIGFVLMLTMSLIGLRSSRFQWTTISFLLLTLAILTNSQRDIPLATSTAANPRAGRIQVAGMQLEFPKDSAVLRALDQLIEDFPQTELLMLSEYTFNRPVPKAVAEWCRVHHRYLLLGAREPAGEANFYNTACIIDPAGEIVFRQVKSVPIQFFKDGLPAPQQQLWESPWGKIGICICYDLSYRRVTDELIRQGAQAILVPTMDVTDWGQQEHELHGRIGPIRAAEYGVPIVRVCSSGISQAIDATGRIMATAPYPGQGSTIFCDVEIGRAGSIPVDRIIAPVTVVITALFLGWLAWRVIRSAESTNGSYVTPHYVSDDG
jgi:apolipoprotein N-acyltransferase